MSAKTETVFREQLIAGQTEYERRWCVVPDGCDAKPVGRLPVLAFLRWDRKAGVGYAISRDATEIIKFIRTGWTEDREGMVRIACFVAEEGRDGRLEFPADVSFRGKINAEIGLDR